MENLIIKSCDTSLQRYELKWVREVLNDFNKREMYNNPSLSLYTSMVYAFAKHLPYSMDIEQPEYVPADFLDMTPHDVDENIWFKWENRRTFFNSLIRWPDTRRTGLILKMCFLFQKMILGEFPVNFKLKEEDYVNMGIDVMTDDFEYNRAFFETLKSLPDHYKKLNSSTDNSKRRKVLEEMYENIINTMTARYGSLRITDEHGNVVRESKGVAPIRPHSDIVMLVYWDYVTYHDGIPSIIEKIKEEQLKKYNSKRLENPNLLTDEGITRKLI